MYQIDVIVATPVYLKKGKFVYKKKFQNANYYFFYRNKKSPQMRCRRVTTLKSEKKLYINWNFRYIGRFQKSILRKYLNCIKIKKFYLDVSKFIRKSILKFYLHNKNKSI